MSAILESSPHALPRRVDIRWGRIASLVVATGFCLAWLLPYRTYPYSQFYNDYVAIIAVLIATFLTFVRSTRRSEPAPLAVLLPLGLAAWITCDALTGRMAAPWDSVIPVGFLLAAAAAMLVGHRLGGTDAATREQTYQNLIAMLLVAGICSAAITWFQYFAIDDRLGDFSVGIANDGKHMIRPFANLAQPNQLATLLCWAVAGVWWLYQRGKLNGVACLMLAATLISSIALTQSKTAWMVLPLIGVVCFAVGRKPGFKRVPLGALAFLALFFAALVIGLPYIAQFTGTPTESIDRRFGTNGVRLVMILQGFDIGLHHPWFGVGWGGFGAEQVRIAPDFADTQYALHAHNFIANLAAEMGLPAALVVVGSIALWCFNRFVRNPLNIETTFVLLVFAAIGIHSMVEFPLWYAYFLVPVAFLVGLVESEATGRRTVSIPRDAILIAGLVGAIAVVALGSDYRRLVQSFRAFGYERIGWDYSLGSTVKPEWTVFPHFYEYMAFAKRPPTVGLSPEELARDERTAERFGYAGVLMRMATVYALNGKPDAAVRTMVSLKHLYPPRYAEGYAAWKTLADEYPAVLAPVYRALPAPDVAP